jgi:hypothetical protein
MLSISVSLDGKELACVQTDGYDVVSVSVRGTRIEDEFAEIDMTASSYPEAGESKYLIWLNSVPIQPGQVVEVNVTEDGETSGAGQTIDELFPSEASSDREEFKVTEEMFTELRARVPNRLGYRFETNLSSGSAVSAQTAPDEHGFGFSVLWNCHRPERASVSLHTYTIDNMALGTPMKYHLNEHLNPGQSASVKVDA